ncbi:MAG: ATPase [Planctomycetes bacterium]|nr:ATPase [Planctomycetota bacterium]
MYRSFHVANFRCFRSLDVGDLQRINLVAGMNNVGKTALLEALFLHCGAYNPELAMRVNVLRGIVSTKIELPEGFERLWSSLFAGFDLGGQVELVGEDIEHGRRVLRLRVVRAPEQFTEIGQLIEPELAQAPGAHVSAARRLELALEYDNGGGQVGKCSMVADLKGIHLRPAPPPPPFRAVFLAARGVIPTAEDAQRFSKMELVGKQDVVCGALRVIEPRLRRLAVVVSGDMPIIHGDVGLNRLVPLSVMGDGMGRLAGLVVAIGDAQDGVVLVDEIENGLHHSILPNVWRVVAEAARQFNVQVFATTHSYECIAAAHKAFAEDLPYQDEFRLHRLDRVKDETVAVTYDRETLAAAIEMGWEVR